MGKLMFLGGNVCGRGQWPSLWGLIPFKSGMELLYNLALLTKQTLCRGICTFLHRIWLVMALGASFEVIHRGPAGKQAQSSTDNRQRKLNRE